MNKTYQKTFNFGTVAYHGKKKINLVQLDVELKVKDKKTIFSASGGIWNSKQTDYITCGQCLEDIWTEFEPQLENAKQFYNILLLWRKFHLNDMHAECEHQEKRGETWTTHPSVKCQRCGWVLGSGWNYRAIPKPYLGDIITLLDVPIEDRLTIYKLAKED